MNREHRRRLFTRLILRRAQAHAVFPKRNHCAAPFSKDGGGPPRFETPRTGLWNLSEWKIAAPHHEGRAEPRLRQIDRKPVMVTWQARPKSLAIAVRRSQD